VGPAFLLLTALGLGVGDEVGGTEGIRWENPTSGSVPSAVCVLGCQ